MEILLSPPLAFLLYLLLTGGLSAAGRRLAEPGHATSLKASTYAGGEAPPTRPTAPGYQPFFVVALFFAVLHLGVLVLSSGDLSPTMGFYLAGLMLVLVVLALK